MPLPSFSEQTSQRLSRLMPVVVTLLVLGFIVAFGVFTQMGKQVIQIVEVLELKTYDARTRIQLPAPKGKDTTGPSPDIIILKFDDLTLSLMSEEYGVWPWPRDVHARMIHYLNKLGVRAILYDILFSAPRKGSEASDRQLVEAFHQYDNVYLSMNLDHNLEDSRKLGKDLTPEDIDTLKRLAVPIQSQLGQSKASHLKLKTENGVTFFQNEFMDYDHYRKLMPGLLDKGKNIGVINHKPDMDGISRGNPLFFRFHYYDFVKTGHWPLKSDEGAWYDAQGHRTDAQGYLYQKSERLPVETQANGDHLDQQGRLTDADGYLLDDYGHYQYQRKSEPSYLYFPYLGLRAALNLEYPDQLPPLHLTADGHFQFGEHDVPLSDNGNFLVNWHNVNLDRQGTEAYLAETRQAIQTLEAQIQSGQISLSELHMATEQLAMKKQALQQTQERMKALEMLLNEPMPYREIPALDLLRIIQKEEGGLELTPLEQELKAFFKDKIIFVGTTALATYDIKNTPIRPDMPGVVIQANLFDNLMQNTDYLRRVHPYINIAVTLLLCLLAAGFAFKMRSALAGILTSTSFAVLYVSSAILLFTYGHWWINVAMPLLVFAVTTTITYVVKYFLRDKDYEKTYAMATTDSMTGLYNHRFFQEHMRRSIEQCEKAKSKFSLILIDIDFFKKFNDTYGHQAGDEVLRCVAAKLKATVRSVDVVARYGGEEMAIILDKTNEEEALAVAEKVVKAVAAEAYPIAEGVAKHVTISCGVSTYPTHGKSTNELIEFSDQGLYRAKENGRNQVGAQYGEHPPEEGETTGENHVA